MTATPASADPRQACAGELAEHGPSWLARAFLAVDRTRFVPGRVWLPEPGSDGLFPVLDREQDPDAWQAAVYELRRPLITQMDDHRTPSEGPARGRFTSSISALRVVAAQLAHLDLHPGHTVLHIGTGTGYDSALMAERTRAHKILTIETDRQLAGTARRNLDASGYGQVRAAVGDGELGWPEGAPYDRVLSTASATRVPPAWIAQTVPGGIIVTPYRGLALLRLAVADDGKSASGPVVDAVTFMALRGRRGGEAPDMRAVIKAQLADAEKSRTDADLSPVRSELGAEFLLHALVPGIRIVFGGTTWWFEARDAASWAAWKPDGRVRQWGPRRLVDEAVLAVAAWRDAGAPALTDLGVTVGAGGECVWAHGPGGPAWPVRDA
ncbi:protein-L-isoaspartate(D-aspartate) O-methyltransferase [Streptomyces sp. NRRL B-1677]|uniref:protein-L-isoaspartate(D-aspartate) O-methyltransferase n=1 Tax=Streptomyces sp. NRRL B-1677 TaxID=2682966 RepID=UPI001892C48F|nr:protein-L-isoaspartate(D-aspartate) O-methyltransferase [Streptomyces sp. NRRL B-1677]MBF6048179.1 protein-L-isoaspartate(D-aspartate) O-methyltransferase [Streptomyces sp. NRRL B-1677]